MIRHTIIHEENGVIFSATGRSYDFIATIENTTDETKEIHFDWTDEYLPLDPHDWTGIPADDEGYEMLASICEGDYIITKGE